LWLVLLLASMTAGGCCDPFSFAMFLHAATDVSTRDLYGDSGPMLLKTDAFIMAGPFEQTLARPGARFGVPPSVACYRSAPLLFPFVKDVVPKGTCVRRTRELLKNIGYIYWYVSWAEIQSGPHQGREFRLQGFGPKVIERTFYSLREDDPNPDLFEFVPLPTVTTQPAAAGDEPRQPPGSD